MPAPESVAFYIISPETRATVACLVTIRFGLEGVGVAPAGVEDKTATTTCWSM